MTRNITIKTAIILSLSLIMLVSVGCNDTAGVGEQESSADLKTVTDKESEEDPGYGKVVLKKGKESMESAIQSEIDEAIKKGYKPFVYFSAAWCGPCQSIKHSMDHKLMMDAFNGTHIIELDVDDWSSELNDSPFAVYVLPVYYEVDASGQPTGRSIDGGAWGENTPDNMAPPLKNFFAAGS